MNGKEIRAQIDTENVKGLLLINGGGAVALLAFLSSILGKPDYEPLARAILWGLLLFAGGLITALIHNHLRRRCSLAYCNPNIGKHKFFSLGLSEPWVCHFSHLFMYASYGLFVFAVILIFCGGSKTFNSTKQSPAKHTSVQNNINVNKNIDIPKSDSK